jgi:hypothetical protein
MAEVEDRLARVPLFSGIKPKDLNRLRGMSAWEFKPFVEEHPEVAWALLETLVGRLREAEVPAEGR